MFGYINVN